MVASDQRRLSVSLVDVEEGSEDEFLSLARDLAAAIRQKGYGRAQIVRDETLPWRFYVVRHWSSAAAAARCRADKGVQAIARKLRQVSRVDRRVESPGPPEGAHRRGPKHRLVPPSARDPRGQIDLVAVARQARENAAAAFSHFKVGAALETAHGTVVSGCNVENATYGLTICAERVAMFKALSDGHRDFTRIAIVADTDAPTPPCGACRQILWEFGGNLEIRLANLTEERGTYWLCDLLPLPFDARLL